MDNMEFEGLLLQNKGAIERFVYYKMPSKIDGNDILQDVYLSAFDRFWSLKDKNSFLAWMIKIAANKCNDFYRDRAKMLHIPLDEITESVLAKSHVGIIENSIVRDTLDALSGKDKQILYLYYFKNKPQAEIAKQLGIPVGTVKSRLFTAKQSFKEAYPPLHILKGEYIMKEFPKVLPEYKIIKTDSDPFEVKCEELAGFSIIPRLGEKLQWAAYDYPEKKITEKVVMSVVGKAVVHGVEGVEILSKEDSMNGQDIHMERIFVAQLTETHCRYLSESHYDGDVKHYSTFLDNDYFIPNWGTGEDNCGNEINVKAKGIIKRNAEIITIPDLSSVIDVAGRHTVEIYGKRYDTICVMNIHMYNNSGIMTETYLDRNGHTVLWRRFNRDDWYISHYKQKWSEKLPESERVIINGMTYVHWYDCITDYIL